MALKRKGGDPVVSSTKSKRVGFATIDCGLVPNECLKVYLVNGLDAVDAKNSVPIDLVDVGHFFSEDGKIYGYRDLKINVWVSCISFHAYADIKFQGSSDGGKGITELKPALQNIFGESLVEKEEFFQTFSSERHCIRNTISSGAVKWTDASGGADDSVANGCKDADTSVIEVVHVDMKRMEVALLYSRLVPLLLLLVEGSSAIDITDPSWDIYFIVEKVRTESGDGSPVFLGFSSVYRFYHYPDSTRLRISQILVLPTHQGRGHGRRLLESINSVATSENLYDVTAEEPSEYLQYLRACVDTPRLLAFEPIKPALNCVVSYLKEGNFSKKKKKFGLYPSADVVEAVREKLKINKKQFFRCWDVLVFLELDQENTKLMEDFKACISESLKSDILDKDAGSNGKHLVELPNEFGQDMTFAVFRSKDGSNQQPCPGSEGNLDGDKAAQEQQLNLVVDERMEEIAEVAQKVLQHSRSSSHTFKP